MEVLSLKSHRMSSIESARICTKSKLGLVQLWCSGSAVQRFSGAANWFRLENQSLASVLLASSYNECDQISDL